MIKIIRSRIRSPLSALGIMTASITAVLIAPTAFATPNIPESYFTQAPETASILRMEPSAVPQDIVRPDAKFMRLPFKRADAKALKITNGWKMASDEAKVLGDSDDHAAIDYEGVKYGTPIYAPADGWAWYSYQSFPMRYQGPYNPLKPSDPNTFWRDPHTGHEGYLGAAGLFVELQFDKEVKRKDGTSLGNITTQFFHMKDVAPGITYLPPVRQADVVAHNGQRIKIWTPVVNKPQEYMRQNASPVKKGQLIGWVGDTGINFGYDDNFNVETGKVEPRDRYKLPPWDPQGVPLLVSPDNAAQVHQQSYIGRGPAPTYSRQNNFDLYDLYAEVKPYHNSYTPVPGTFRSGPKGVFETNMFGQPKYIDD